MKKMNTTTKITTEYCAFGKKKDGTWRKFINNRTIAEYAEKDVAEHKKNRKLYPGSYDEYSEYEVRKRTVITTYEEWQ